MSKELPPRGFHQKDLLPTPKLVELDPPQQERLDHLVSDEFVAKLPERLLADKKYPTTTFIAILINQLGVEDTKVFLAQMLRETKLAYVESVRYVIVDLNGFLKSNREAFIERNKYHLKIRTLCTGQIQALGLPVANSGLVPIENNLARSALEHSQCGK